MKQKKKLHDKLLILAKAKGITQAEIAKEVGMQPSHINRYFKGSSDLVSEHFVDITRVLGIDIDYTVTAELTKLTTDEDSDVNNLSSSVTYLLNSLDDIGRQTMLKHLLWAAEKTSKRKIPENIAYIVRKEISKI